MYVDTFGKIPVKIKLFKDEKSMVVDEDLSGEYEDLEVESVEAAMQEIKENILNYFDCMSCQKYYQESDNKQSYVIMFLDNFNIDYPTATDDYYDLKIEVLEIDTSLLKITVEEQ